MKISALIAKIFQSNDFRIINNGVTSQKTNQREKRRRSGGRRKLATVLPRRDYENCVVLHGRFGMKKP